MLELSTVGALIRRWQTLRQWVDEDREFLVWLGDLRPTIRLWHKRNKDKSVLLRGGMLSDALAWRRTHVGYLGEEDLSFIDESRKKKQLKIILPFLIPLTIAGFLSEPQQNPLKINPLESKPRQMSDSALLISPSVGQGIEPYKASLKLGSIKTLFDTGVFQEKFTESASVRHQIAVHNIMNNDMLRRQKHELFIPFLQDCRATPLYRTFMEGIKFFHQVEESGREAVYAERTQADLKKYGDLLEPPPSGQSKFDQVLEWAQKQQEQ
ncbi:MAG: hypothetical protein D3924_16015 [Candidatus Electrothrix sp. AR4]|nr:hypothetical protein [Candidatus Electrothrix sp. AR4]